MWNPLSSHSKRGSNGRQPLPNGRSGHAPPASRFTAIMHGSLTTEQMSPIEPRREPLIGSLPASVYAEILSYLPVYDIPAIARTCKRLAKVVRTDNAAWRRRCVLLMLQVDLPSSADVDLGNLDTPSSPRTSISSHPRNPSIPMLPKPNRAQDNLGDFGNFVIDDADDGFGDFEQAKKIGSGRFIGTNKPSLIDMNFDLNDVPLPSSMTTMKGARKPSGFFGLVAPPIPAVKSPTTDRHKRQSASYAKSSASAAAALSPYYTAYKAHHIVYWDYVRTLRSTSPSASNGNASVSPSQLLSLLFPSTPSGSPSLSAQAQTLSQILRFLGKDNQPSRDWGWLRQILGGCCDRFDAICLNAFDKAESRLTANSTRGQGHALKRSEREAIARADLGQAERNAMREAAESSWILHLAREEDRESSGRRGAGLAGWANRGAGTTIERQEAWELGRVWVEKKEVFYEGSKWDPSENIVRVTGAEAEYGSHRLDFNPMDAFMGHILAAIMSDGQDAVEVFPPETGRSVMLAYVDRLAADVLAEYINPLLHQAKLLSQKLFLSATAATFIQAWRVVDAVCTVLTSGDAGMMLLDGQTLRTSVGAIIFDMFEVNMDDYLEEEIESINATLASICTAWDKTLAGKGEKPGTTGTAFIASSNPALAKKNVLAGFRDVLLLPVTIVPLTVNYGVSAITAGGNQVVNGLSMLNPQKWTNPNPAVKTGARADLEKEAAAAEDEKAGGVWVPPVVDELPSGLMAPSDSEQINGMTKEDAPVDTIVSPAGDAAATSREASKDAFDQLQMLLSLDVVLELIQADRETLKRVETFRDYPGKRGKAVRDTIEEVFILLLQALGNRHIAPGFKTAIAQMGTYEPGQDEGTTTSVAPLVQFFELVHVGDTIQSIVQTYFDKDLAMYVDRSDFLNGAVQEKKRFEGTLDDSVAGGLNAGIEVLMNQVDHIIQTRTPPGAYCPPDTAEMELGPTQGCQDAIRCLQQHCELLKGSTSKDVLEVFYQEVGIRLQAILQRYIKRQIISQIGGFQVIADLNAYHHFITTLKQQRLTDDFSNLKMLGHVYIVADAKDLASIVRDVTRYGGTFTPEDLYEFIQRRSDWRKISKTVDQAMYALSVTEDCVIM